MKANANVAGIFLLFIFLLRAVGLEAYQYPSVPRTVTKRSHEASFIKFYNDVDLLPTASPFQANALHQRSCARKNIILQSDISGNDVIDLLPTKKDSLQEKYKMASILYRIIATIFFGMPDKTFTTRLASKFGGAAGFGVASGVSYILSKATGKDRLGSETYKRLNVGLLGFSILGLFAIPGEAAFLPKALPAMLLSMGASAARLYVAFVSYLGWSWGVLQNRPEAVVTNKESSRMLLTPKLALTEILQGMKNSIKGMKVIKANKKKSLFYRNAGLLVLFGMFSSFMQGLFNVRVSERYQKVLQDSSLVNQKKEGSVSTNHSSFLATLVRFGT